MPIQNANNQLAAILTLSQSMLELARHESWDGIAPVYLQRQHLLEALLQEPAHTYPAGLAEAIRQVLAIDQEVMAAARAGRDNIASLLGQFGEGRAAIKTYQGMQLDP